MKTLVTTRTGTDPPSSLSLGLPGPLLCVITATSSYHRKFNHHFTEILFLSRCFWFTREGGQPRTLT